MQFGLMSLSGWKYSGIVCSISDRYNTLFIRVSIDTLYDEFCEYQTLSEFEIGQSAWQDTKVADLVEEDGTLECHYGADVLW